MPPRKKKDTKPEDMKAILWKSADKLRGSLDAAEYKHFVLGLVFLKYVSAAMAEKREQLEAELRAEGGWSEQAILETLEERDEYTGAGIFYVPPTARWETVLESAKGTLEGQTIGEAIDAAMRAIEGFNPSLKNTLPKIYNSGRVDNQRLADLVKLLDRLIFQAQVGEDGKRTGARDLMGECTSTSSGSSRFRRAGRAGSSSPRRVWSNCWWKCWSRWRASGFSTRRAVRVACSCRRRSSSRRMAVTRSTSRSSGRNAI